MAWHNTGILKRIGQALVTVLLLTVIAACASPPDIGAVRPDAEQAPPDNAPAAESAMQADTEPEQVTSDEMVIDTTQAVTATQTTTSTGTVAPTALQVSHGPMSGEVTDTSAVLWSRGSMSGTLTFEVAASDAFTEIVQSVTTEVDAASDFTGKTRVEGLEPGQEYAYRVTLAADGDSSEPVVGQFATAPVTDTAAAFSFVFSSCLGGQNYCRPVDTGWTIFETMASEQPDFFILTGDSIYSSGVCEGEDNVAGAEGPYSDLAGYRTRYRYHLEDPLYASFLAETPVFVTWDDHEIMDNFGGPALEAVNPQRFADGKQAYFEYWPLTGSEDDPDRIYRQVSYGAQADFFILDTRSYRDPNVNWDPNPNSLDPKSMLGKEQFAWLQAGLQDSQATWKFVVSSVPLSYPTGFPQPEVDGRDGWANYTERSGYESELQALLFFIAQHDIDNVVFLVGDTHWPYALSYDPDRDGTPNFYELGSSPMSALVLSPPETPDPSFNPTVLYAEGEFGAELFNFGHVAVDDAGELTFRVVDSQGSERYTLTLPPQ